MQYAGQHVYHGNMAHCITTKHDWVYTIDSIVLSKHGIL